MVVAKDLRVCWLIAWAFRVSSQNISIAAQAKDHVSGRSRGWEAALHRMTRDGSTCTKQL